MNARAPLPRRSGRTRPRALGFSLVEIMVAALIGLIGSVVIFQVFALSEGQKRTTTGGADAQQSGLLALFMIERDARTAGYGLNYTPLLDCNVLLHDDGPPSRDTSFRLTGVRITDGAAGAPDSIRFVYSSADLSVAPVRLNASSAAASTVHKVAIRYGFNVGDLIVASEVGSSKNCTLQQVTSLPTAPTTDEVVHETARYNTASTVAYIPWSNTTQSGGVVSNLGASPTVITYAIAGGQLTTQNLISSDTTTAVMDGIVQLQAQYGKDTDGDGDVDGWNTTDPTNFVDWSRVIALRVAILARSGQFERTAVTPTAPRWTDGNGAAVDFTLTNVDGSPDSGAGSLGPNNWRNYRYRVFQTTVPLRNLIWFPL